MSLSISEKKKQVDAIMAEVPQETLEMLPLPPALYKLPATELSAAKKIFANKNLSFDEKNEAVRKFIQSLPTHLKRLVRPPLPRGFENLPEEVCRQGKAIEFWGNAGPTTQNFVFYLHANVFTDQGQNR